MTEPKDSDIPGLDALAARYRQRTAPPGFTARVMTAVDGQAPRAWYRQPRWALAAAVLLVVAISLPLLRDSRTPSPAAPIGPETAVLASATGLFIANDSGLPLSVAEIPDVMSVQSIADIPDPFS